MKVLIHALGADVGGGRRHVLNFLPALDRARDDHEYTVLVRSSIAAACPDFHRLKLEQLPDDQARGWLARLWFDNRTLRRRTEQEGFQRLVSLTNYGPTRSPIPHVVYQHNPRYFSPHVRPAGLMAGLELFLRRRLTIRVMGGAQLILTPSDAMTGMIRQSCPSLRGARFRTLYLGYSPEGYGQPLAPGIRGALSQRGDRPRLLYPALPYPHKAFDLLFETLCHLKERGHRFVQLLTTDEPALVRQAARAGLEAEVLFLGQVDPSQMGALYQAADVMLFPSRCESFGFPFLEAMGHDLPVVASQIPVHQEICQQGALYFPLNVPQAAADRVMEALDPATRDRLIQGGRERLSGFDWGWERHVRVFQECLAL